MIAVRSLYLILYNFIFFLNRRLICLKTIKRWDYWKMSRRLDSTTDPSLCLPRKWYYMQPLNIERFCFFCLCVKCLTNEEYNRKQVLQTWWLKELRMEYWKKKKTDEAHMWNAMHSSWVDMTQSFYMHVHTNIEHIDTFCVWLCAC